MVQEIDIKTRIEQQLRAAPRKTGDVVAAVERDLGSAGQVREVLWRMLDAGRVKVMTDWKLQLNDHE